MPATSSVVGSCAEPASLPWLLWVHFARKCRYIFVWCSREGSFVGLYGLHPELFDIQGVKLCLSFCRAGNKRCRCDIGTPEAKSQGGGLSGDVAGARVHAKVISFFALAGNGRGSQCVDWQRSIQFFGGGRCTREYKAQ